MASPKSSNPLIFHNSHIYQAGQGRQSEELPAGGGRAEGLESQIRWQIDTSDNE